jgi:hypothetical protein
MTRALHARASHVLTSLPRIVNDFRRVATYGVHSRT